MTTSASGLTSGFYVLGGTLPGDADCYVARQADQELLDGLRRGQFCYILTSRQMGKSSLMVRTVARLRQDRITCVALDLTAIGQNVTEEQWYDGLLNSAAVQLDLEEEMDAFWLKNRHLGPLQRWMQALETVLLPHVAGRIVIFVDEIDAVRSLPFSADEWFAGIRECYNRRASDPDFQRLTFCLLGVATPADLIRDTRTTPFNIGRRIELADFTAAEAVPLAEGLPGRSESRGKDDEKASPLMDRILYWTSGHPYLTQRLCQAVAEALADGQEQRIGYTLPLTPFASLVFRVRRGAIGKGGAGGALRLSPVDASSLVDRICHDLLLTAGARGTDDNLLFVRERLLRSEVDRAGLLEIYSRVRAGKTVKDDETNPLLSVLRLSGIVRVERTRLRVRNRIYARVFDRDWLRANMPDAELRRQKMAYRRGFVRATALATVVVASTATLAWTAIREKQRAQTFAAAARTQTARASEQALTAQRYLYAANLNLAQQAWETRNYSRVRQLLQETRPEPGTPDLRGFEWGLIQRRGHFDLPFLPDASSYVTTSLVFSEEGRFLRTSDGHGLIRFWDAWTGQSVPKPEGVTFLFPKSGVSPDGRLKVTGRHYESEDLEYRHSTLTLQEAGKPARTLQNAMLPAVFSPDGRRLAARSADGITLWDTATGKRIQNFPGCSEPFAFSPDGLRMAAESFAYGWGVQIFDLTSSREPFALPGTEDAAALSPDGALLATLDRDWQGVTIRESGNLTVRHRLPGAENPMAFVEGGKTLVTTLHSAAGTLALWDMTTGRQAGRIDLGHVGDVTELSAPASGSLLAISTMQAGVQLRDIRTQQVVRTFPKGQRSAVFSADGKTLAFVEAGTGVALVDVASGTRLRFLEGASAPLAYVPDGQTLAAGDTGNTLALWDLRTGAKRVTLRAQRYMPHVCAFSPDGKRLAAGDSGEYQVAIWDTATGQETFRIPGKTERTDVADYALFFSPDGLRLYSGNQSGVLKIWQAAPLR